MKIHKPKNGEFPPYAVIYLDQVPDDGDLIKHLEKGKHLVTEFYSGRTETELNYRYQPDKWTIKDILGHIIDDERVFCYRALRFARNDKTELPGVDQDIDAEYAAACHRKLSDLLDEYEKVRDSSVALFNSFNEEMISRCGTAGGHYVSVSALGYLIAGHELHHLEVIKERYI